MTDADVALGRIDPEGFAGGSIGLSAEAAAAAIGREVAGPLGLDGTTAAFGIAEVVDENMANAARVHAVENGEDLATYTVIAFGGAAPLHAGRLCQKLGIDRFLVPPGAGVGSAIGFLRAPFSFEATRSQRMTISAFSPAAVRRVLAELRQEAAAFVRSCGTEAEIAFETRAYMRYLGQGWEIPVDLSPEDAEDPTAERCLALFEEAYRALFGRIVDGVEVEVTSWAVNAGTTAPLSEPVAAPGASSGISAEARREVFEPELGRMTEAGIVARDSLRSGQGLAGPALITEAETTIVVPAGFAASVRADGSIEVARVAAAREAAE